MSECYSCYYNPCMCAILEKIENINPENNGYIHELEERINFLEEELDKITSVVKEINDYIENQISEE